MTTTTQNTPDYKVGDRVHIEAPDILISADATVVALPGGADRSGNRIGTNRICVDLDRDQGDIGVDRHGWHFDLQRVTPLAPASPRFVVVQRTGGRRPAVHDTHLDRFAGFGTPNGAERAAARMNDATMSPVGLVWRHRTSVPDWFEAESTEPAEGVVVVAAAARVAAFLEACSRTTVSQLHVSEWEGIDSKTHSLLVSDLRILLAEVTR